MWQQESKKKTLKKLLNRGGGEAPRVTKTIVEGNTPKATGTASSKSVIITNTGKMGRQRKRRGGALEEGGRRRQNRESRSQWEKDLSVGPLEKGQAWQEGRDNYAPEKSGMPDSKKGGGIKKHAKKQRRNGRIRKDPKTQRKKIRGGGVFLPG